MSLQRFKIIAFSLLTVIFSSCAEKETAHDDYKIWFDKPTNKWNEGLPIGNGSFGAMVFGTPQKEQITLNEETIWSGKKNYEADKKGGAAHLSEIRELIFDRKYAEAEAMVSDKLLGERAPSGSVAYQMLGNLVIQRDNVDDYSQYKRSLNLNNACAQTEFESQGIKYYSEALSSYPDQTVVLRYTANKDKAISFSAWVKRSPDTKIVYTEEGIEFSEHVNHGVGVKFHSIVNFDVRNGDVSVENGQFKVTDADEVIIRIVAASDYWGDEPKAKCEETLAKVLSKDYEEIKRDHIADYKYYFDRVELHLSEAQTQDLPTDVRLKNVKNGAVDNYLTELQYHFGRYLLISSSRPGTLPANLQGIWVTGFTPPWNSDYHININIQMNYWPAEMVNLSECHEPFLKFIGNLREMGRITAKETYGCRGFVAHHTSDAWYSTYAFGKPGYGMWPMGAAWCCEHLYTHYEYTEDKDYLRDYAYPIMKEAALFFVDFLVKDPHTGLYVSGPSISPENRFLTEDGKTVAVNMGPTMDRAIIFELFTNCIKSAKVLGIDDDFVQILEDKMAQMPPLEIGSDGRLMEWTEEFKEKDPGHRHISHLYALHPSNQISKTLTPELFDAAKKTIEYRLSHGGGHTGWSRAWIINFWARLLEAEKAHENILALQRKSTLPNLLDLHPPFQIDGNFGLVSGMTEMLMQTHVGEINILPALPQAWANGNVKGIVARGGFVVDMEWADGELLQIKVVSRLGNDLKLRYKGQVKQLNTVKGQTLLFDAHLNQL